MTHSIPDAGAVALTTRAGHGARHRRLQVRPDAGRRHPRRRRRAWPSWASEGLLLLCGDSTNADRPGLLAQRGDRRARSCEEVFLRCEGRIVVTSLRLEHPSRPAGRRRGRRARAQGLARRALDAQERQHRALAGPHRGARGDPRPAARARGLARRQARDHLHRVPGRAAERAAAHGPPRPSAGRAAPRRHGLFSATPIPGNERAVNETIDRLYHIGCDVITTRDAPIHASGHGYAGGAQADAQPDAAALRDALPRRPQAHPPARPARRGGRDRRRQRLQGRERACRSSSTAAARASASPSSRG